MPQPIPPDAPYRTLRCRTEGAVLVVEIDHPPRNLMTSEMIGELGDLVRRLENERTVGAVVLTGALPGIFVAHFDVEEIRAGAKRFALTVTPGQARAALGALSAAGHVPGVRRLLGRTALAGTLSILEINDLFDRMGRLDKVFVAAINGVAFGGGLELALACDIRLMSADAEGTGLPEVLLGLIPGAGGSQRLTRLVGPGRALEIMLEGRPLTPDAAERLGVIHRTVPAGRLMEEAIATAARVARRSPESIAAVKRAVYHDASLPLRPGVRRDAAAFMHLATTEAVARSLATYAGIAAPDAPASAAEIREALQSMGGDTGAGA